MSTLAKNEICKRLSHEVYGYDTDDILKKYPRTKVKKINQVDETELLTDSRQYYRTSTGLVAAFYYDEFSNEGVIAYRGTERKGLGEDVLDLRDWQNNLSLMQDKIPSQFYDALYFYNTVYNQYKDKGTTIYITGHSLGGALAQLVSSCSAGTHQTFTFNAPGVMHLLDNIKTQTGSQLKNSYSHITNYAVLNDWCGMVHTHIGNLYVLPPQPIRKLVSSNGIALYAPFIDTHEPILNMNLNNAKTKPVGFNEPEALSLWYYDVNNYMNSNAASPPAAIVRECLKYIVAKISPTALKHAVEVLNNYPEIIKDYDFHFKVDGQEVWFTKTGKVFVGTSKSEFIYGNNQIDGINASGGNDLVYGDEGNDTLHGNTGNDTIYGNENDDILYGDAGNDVLYGNEGNDTLYGGSGIDTLYGGSGRDYLSGGSGTDFYILEKYSNDTIGDSVCRLG